MNGGRRCSGAASTRSPWGAEPPAHLSPCAGGGDWGPANGRGAEQEVAVILILLVLVFALAMGGLRFTMLWYVAGAVLLVALALFLVRRYRR